MRTKTIAMSAALMAAASAPACAASLDGAYRGTLNCAKLSWTKAPLTNEPVSIAVMDGKASYSRVLYGADRTTAIGQESGTGTVETDGTIALAGGSAGKLGTMKATYKGKIESGAGILNGVQSVTYHGKTEIRACTLQLNP